MATITAPEFPMELRDALCKGAKRLGNGLNALEWPNSGKDAPCSELNGILNAHYFLANQEPTFYCYAEAPMARTQRVDLIGCNGDIAIALEAKAFGNINERSTSIFADLQRLRSFVPEYSNPGAASLPKDWWRDAKQRWGLLLITSFRGAEVAQAWQANDLQQAFETMQTYKSSKDRPANMDAGVMQLLNVPDLVRFSAPITSDEKWGESDAGWLLCGAVPL